MRITSRQPTLHELNQMTRRKDCARCVYAGKIRLDELSIAPLLTTKLLSRQIVLPDVIAYLILDFEALTSLSTLFNIMSLLVSLCPFSGITQ
jgi:hypothetical protein